MRIYNAVAPKAMMMRAECELNSAKTGELPLKRKSMHFEKDVAPVCDG